MKINSPNLSVHACTTNSAEELDDSDLCAKTRPDGTHLETDDATADDDHLFRDLLKVKRASGADDLLLVDLDARERSDFGAGGDDDVLAFNLCVTALVERNVDRGGGCKGGGTLVVVDLVLLEQTFDTLGKASNGSGLSLEHLWQVQRHVLDIDTAAFEVVLCLVIQVGVVKHRLGRDAADVQAGATECATLLDASGLIRQEKVAKESATEQLSSRLEKDARTFSPSCAALIAATYPPGPVRRNTEDVNTRVGRKLDHSSAGHRRVHWNQLCYSYDMCPLG